MKAEVNRRHVLLGGVAAVGGAALASSKLDEVERTLFGVVEGVRLPDAIRLLGHRGKTVRFKESATFLRDRPVALDAFRPGDEVMAQGDWKGSTFWAEHMEATYRPLEGRLLRRRGNELRLTTGTVWVIGDTQPEEGEGVQAKPISQLAAGDVLIGTARWEPERDALVALRIGVRRPGG